MQLPPPFIPDKDHIHAIIETPKGSRSKYVYDPETQFFKLMKTLPTGTAFPLDFGFIPGTKADDGDPVDVLVLTEQGLEMGCLVECRVIGVIEAEQQDKGKEVQRNDRILAVPVVSKNLDHIQTIDDVGTGLLDDLTHFFEYYRAMSGGTFKPLGQKGPAQALALIKQKLI